MHDIEPATSLIPCQAACCTISSCLLGSPSEVICRGCTSTGICFCLKNTTKGCRLEGDEFILQEGKCSLVMPSTCIKQNGLCWCLDSRCALPCDNDVPCLYTICFITCCYNYQCKIGVCKKIGDL